MIELDSELDLAALDPAEEQRLGDLLRAAYAPTEIDPVRHERLLLAALEDPFAPATAEELVESERLRQALDGHGDHEDLALARALASAFAPGARSPSVLAELAEARAPSPAPQHSERRKSNVFFLRFAGGGAALAAAAAVLLSVLPSPRRDSAPDLPALALAQSRSTAPLFQADSAGAASNRIDRIASARGRELRDNRYALWGVR